MKRNGLLLAALLVVIAAGIRYQLRQPAPAVTDRADTATAGPASPNPPAPAADVTIYFSRGDSSVAVQRRVAADSSDPAQALRSLLAGPTAAEQASGIASWFSARTAGYLRSFRLAADGTGHVDFADLRRVIPSASSSAGSELLLRELNQTLFQFPEVKAIEYTIDGSCESFWSWLQYDCQVVRRTRP